LPETTDRIAADQLVGAQPNVAAVGARTLEGQEDWQELVMFVERYGADIFTQRFLNLANLRAILHHGLPLWLQQLLDDEDSELDWRLLEDLRHGHCRRKSPRSTCR
jgi:hypothetical protein